ncbi:MAG TPA: glycosyltransferase family 4 protein [Pseudomonadales bacterium]
MRIAQVAPLYETVPPRFYGGTERIVGYLSDALVELGHHVTLFAAAGRPGLAELVPTRDQAIRLDPFPLKSDLAAHLVMLDEVRRRADEFDVIHFHIDMLHFPLFEKIAGRTLTTMHGRLDLKDLPGVYTRWWQFPLVSISDHQRRPLEGANWIATSHHGLPPDLYAPATQPDNGYLVFLGRICPEKRPDRAIEIARRAGIPLKIAAKVDPVDVGWFEQAIEPLLDDPLIEFLGEVDDLRKGELLANARATLFPIDWPEPFGLVMIESMACGTPVIGWNCGSVPEVLEDGLTGAVVTSVDAAVEAIGRVGELDRARIRHEFERRFSAPIMAGRYVDLYERLLENERAAGRRLEAV